MKNIINRYLFSFALTILIVSPRITLAQNIIKSYTERRILVSEYRDKMTAGWIGQMVGVGWGAPTEFRFMEQIIPEDEVPEWFPDMVNVFYQDDLYVEITFLNTLDKYGFDVSGKQAGIEFANSKYMLWHANDAGRNNLRIGIAPPNSGHPEFNKHSDDIDYQIESDYSGLIAPGLPNMVIELGEKFGRLMNYGDGLYGGQFVGGMYSEAFFEKDILKIIKAGLDCIPNESQYAKAVRDVIKWYSENPNDWEVTWELINEKYHKNPDYKRSSCVIEGFPEFNIDAKLNGAYIVMGLLYGNGDLDETIKISMRCGQDSDCNPSNAAGILFTTIGYRDLPEKFKSSIDVYTKFSYTDYSYPELIELSERLAILAIERAGGYIEKDADGNEVFVIPIINPLPSNFEQSWNPDLTSDIKFTKSELAQIKGYFPFEYLLEQNYPNPFNNITTISYILTDKSDVNILIYDILGRQIRKMEYNDQSIGSYYINWDGTDKNGDPVSTGLYLYQLVTRDFIQTKKMILLK
jgi:hypothetical protein